MTANTAESLTIDDFKRWKVDILRKYCQDRDIVSSFKRKEEMVALAYAAFPQNYAVVASKQQETSDAYTDNTLILLTLPIETAGFPLRRM